MTRKIHTSRPKLGGARIAWDYFERAYKETPVRMWFTHLSYYVWVAEFANGETEDIDNLSLAHKRHAQVTETKGNHA